MQTPSGHPVESTSAKRLVVLASGGGSNLAALLAAHDAAYGARVVGLVTDRPTAGALDLARDAGVASAVVALKDFDDRAAWNDGVLEAISVFRPDYVILAGFMRILAPGVGRGGLGRRDGGRPGPRGGARVRRRAGRGRRGGRPGREGHRAVRRGGGPTRRLGAHRGIRRLGPRAGSRAESRAAGRRTGR